MKLNWDQVRAMRAELAAGSSLKEQAEKYGVTPALVAQIKSEKVWSETRKKLGAKPGHDGGVQPLPPSRFMTHVRSCSDCTVPDFCPEARMMIESVRTIS